MTKRVRFTSQSDENRFEVPFECVRKTSKLSETNTFYNIDALRFRFEEPQSLETCTFYYIKPIVFMKAIDFAEAVPFF